MVKKSTKKKPAKKAAPKKPRKTARKKKVSTREHKEVISLQVQAPGLLDDIDLHIVAKFSMVEIKMKNDWRWKVKMSVHKILPSAYHDYEIKLEFDDRPYLKTIEQLEKELDDLGRNPTLLPDVDKKSLDELDKRIAGTRDEMDRMKSECPDIEFVTQTEEIKYKNGDTVLLFNVLDTVIEPLNKYKHRLGDYRAVLTPTF